MSWMWRTTSSGDVYSAPAVYLKEAGNWKIYYICRDYLGSITHIANSDGSLKAEYSYDAWGRLRNPATHVAYAPGSEPVLFLRRGYTGHEHLYWFGLVNMNARLYDAALGRFLSPDPYVQMPDFTQNFNRYSYCLNNPLVYVDQDGEFWHIVIGAIVGGVGNLVANWKNIDGFWAVAGVSAGGGALVATNNDIVAQTGKNFSGFDNINWEQVGKSTFIGGVSGFAGGSAGYWAANSSLLVNNINSPVLRSAVVSPLASGAGHVAGGITAGVLEGQSLGTAFNNSLNGLGGSMAMGGAIGIASTIGVSYANKVNPWTGKDLNTSISSQATPNDLNISSDVFTVTPDGIALPKGAYIPDNLIENPYGKIGSYGNIVDGKFIESVRIDSPTLLDIKVQIQVISI